MAAVGEAGADRFRPHFLAIEWDDMVDAWQLDAWKRDRALRPVGGRTDYATAVVVWAGPSYVVLDERRDVISGHLTVCTMHLAKGLEFRAVMVIDRGCAGFPRRPLLGSSVNRGIPTPTRGRTSTSR